MSLRKKEYLDRLVDKKIEDYLEVFGAISIEGPKWCGKTWTALNHANSVIYLDEEEVREKANLSMEYILNDAKPELIDEWNLVPKTWDAVRRKCDDTSSKGNYILTCSTKLSDDLQKENIHHSGAGRIGKIKMHTMSLYESGDSTGVASLTDIFGLTLKPFGAFVNTNLRDILLGDPNSTSSILIFSNSVSSETSFWDFFRYLKKVRKSM